MKLLATCQEGFLFKKSVTYEYKLVSMVGWMGLSTYLNYFFYMTRLRVYSWQSVSSMLKSLILRYRCFYISRVRLN